MATQKKAKLALRIVSCILALTQLTGSVIAYIIASYSDISPTTVATILTMPSLVGLFVSFAIGPVALKINKKYLIIVSEACNLIYFAAFALVGSGGPFTLLLIAAGISGVARGSSIALVNAAVCEFFEPEKRASYLAVNTALMNGGFALINIIGSAIGASNGGANWNQAYYVGIVILPALIAFAVLMPKSPGGGDADCAAWLPPEDGVREGAPKGGIPPRVFLIALVATVYIVGYCSYLYSYSEYIIAEYKLGTSTHAGLSYSLTTLVGLIIGFTFFFWSKLFRRWIVPIGYGCVAAGLLLMMTVHQSLAGVYACALLMGFGNNIASPYIMSQIMAVTPQRLIPVSMSIYMGGANISLYFSLYILNFTGGLLGGGISKTLMVGFICAALCAAAAVFLYSIRTGKDVLAGGNAYGHGKLRGLQE